jgi:hypothetical protein
VVEEMKRWKGVNVKGIGRDKKKMIILKRKAS